MLVLRAQITTILAVDVWSMGPLEIIRRTSTRSKNRGRRTGLKESLAPFKTLFQSKCWVLVPHARQVTSKLPVAGQHVRYARRVNTQLQVVMWQSWTARLARRAPTPLPQGPTIGTSVGSAPDTRPRHQDRDRRRIVNVMLDIQVLLMSGIQALDPHAPIRPILVESLAATAVAMAVALAVTVLSWRVRQPS